MAARQDVKNKGKMRISRLIAAKRNDIFDAWTDPEIVRQWISDDPENPWPVEMNAEVGGRFRIDMMPAGDDPEHTGVFRVLIRPHKIIFTWVSKWTDHLPSLVTIDLVDRREGAELVLTHEFLPDQWVEGHEKGWSRFVSRLSNYLLQKRQAESREQQETRG